MTGVSTDGAAVVAMLCELEKRAKRLRMGLQRPCAFEVPAQLVAAEVESLRVLVSCLAAFAASVCQAADGE